MHMAMLVQSFLNGIGELHEERNHKVLLVLFTKDDIDTNQYVYFL